MNRILQEQWKKPLPASFVRNTPVLENLAAAVRDGASIIELVGLVGTGKTTLLKSIEHDRPAWVDGVVEYFVSSRSFPLTQAIDVIADGFRASRGNHLLVIDGAELLEKGDLLEAINRLGTGPWRFSVRRRNIWRRLGVAVKESGPRQGLVFRRRACGVASGDVRWSAS